MRGRYILHVRDGQGRITTTCRACDATRTEWSDRHVDHWQRAHQCDPEGRHTDSGARVAREVVGVETEGDRRDTNVAAYGFRSHGQLSTYRLGCRCDPCVKVRRAFLAKNKKPRKARIYDE